MGQAAQRKRLRRELPDRFADRNARLFTARAADALVRLAPARPPVPWAQVDAVGPPTHFRAYLTRTSGRRLHAILSVEDRGPDGLWAHLSVSEAIDIPTWEELAFAKQCFLGDREAYQVLPPRERYVNVDPRVLHLWSRLDRPDGVLPDFTDGLGLI